MAVHQAVEHTRSRRLADGGGNFGGRNIAVFLDIHALSVNEVFLRGKRHTACDATEPPRSDPAPCRKRGAGSTTYWEEIHDHCLFHPLPDRSVPARRIQKICRELGPYHSPMRRPSYRIFSSL